MKQTDPHFKLRIPPDLKLRIEESAKASGRTMSAEIVFRVQEALDNEEKGQAAIRRYLEREKLRAKIPDKTPEQLLEDIRLSTERLANTLKYVTERFEVSMKTAKKLELSQPKPAGQ